MVQNRLRPLLRQQWGGEGNTGIRGSREEYNNTSSYPTSIRAAKIKVSITSPSNKNIAIQYRHRPQSFIFPVICFV